MPIAVDNEYIADDIFLLNKRFKFILTVGSIW